MLLAVVYMVLGAGVAFVAVPAHSGPAFILGLVLFILGVVLRSQEIRQRRQVQAYLQMAMDVAQKRRV